MYKFVTKFNYILFYFYFFHSEIKYKKTIFLTFFFFSKYFLRTKHNEVD